MLIYRMADEGDMKKAGDRIREMPDSSILAAGLSVPADRADMVRKKLRDAGRMYPGAVPLREGDRVIFPIIPPVPPGVEGDLLTTVFRTRDRGPGTYKDVLRHSMPGELIKRLPSSFDVIGDMAIMKLPDDMLEHGEEIGKAVMTANRSLRAVFLDRGVRGEDRVRDLVLMAGSGDAACRHRENGIILEVDLQRAYFSPRLAMERSRVAGAVAPESAVLDMFAGVGPFSILMARNGGARVCAVDSNPHALELLRRNSVLNHVEDLVETIQGDASAVARELAAQGRLFDSVIMNLPHGARAHLPAAMDVLAPGGTIFYYEMLDPEGADARTEWVRDLGLAVEDIRRVHPYSPTVSMFHPLPGQQDPPGDDRRRPLSPICRLRSRKLPIPPGPGLSGSPGVHCGSAIHCHL